MPIPGAKQLAQVPHGRQLAGMAGAPLDAGLAANSLVFSGNGRATRAAATNPPTTTITLACWVNMADVQTPVTALFKGLAATNVMDIELQVRLGALRVSVNNGSQTFVSGLVIPASTWTFIGATATGTTLTAVVNAVTAPTAESVGLSTNGTDLVAGARGQGNFMTGSLALPRWWSRALSVLELAAVYAQAAPANGLCAEWLFAEGGGARAFDTSGNGNDGTLVNATYSGNAPG